MTLHIFNPEHDIALASGLANFTAPHAGRQLRHDLGWLPVLWAADGDSVLVDDADLATKAINRLSAKMPLPRVVLNQIQADEIIPWGWDAALKALLLRKQVDRQLLPTDEQLLLVRQLSHRRIAAGVLGKLLVQIHNDMLIGQSTECHTEQQVLMAISQWNKVVIKAPWSSSGRGIRFVEGCMTISTTGWLRHILQDQGSVMVEPYFNKVKDFGMEFECDGQGHIRYLGLSLFHTLNGAYTGNVLATETYKQEQLSRYLPLSLLTEVQQAICTILGTDANDESILKDYAGPFGVDMMICNSPLQPGQLVLHPCVEINLRRTMGHAALSLTQLINPQADDELVRVMRIAYDNNRYKLKIQRL